MSFKQAESLASNGRYEAALAGDEADGEYQKHMADAVAYLSQAVEVLALALHEKD